MQPGPTEAAPKDAPPPNRPKSIRFVDSMPRPLLLVFLVFAATGIGLVVWLLTNPPAPRALPLELRRSPPAGAFTHDVVRARLLDIPSPLPSFRPPCPEVAGLVIEGGEGAIERLGSRPDGLAAVQQLCPFAKPDPLVPPDLQQAVRALAGARIRFALFTRTGDLSTADLSSRRILLGVALSRVNVDQRTIAPLLAHEGYHLAQGGPVTAAQEFRARVVELAACRFIVDADEFPRWCREADAIIRLGEERAVALLTRAGFPQ
jgi:hypothetical protein